MKTTPSSQPEPVPHTLIVTWNSGQETLNMDEIKIALNAHPPGAKSKTIEYRREENRDIVYEPTLKKTEDGFSLTYNDPGHWADDDGELHKADGALGVAVYHEEEKNGTIRWVCRWFLDGGSKKGALIPCESSTATRDYKEVKVRVRDAKFRDLILGPEAFCLVTRESKREVLEAAHIDEVHNDGRELWENGIVLRADIHKLFDKHIVTVDEQGNFSMDPVPASYEYLFEDDKKTWKGGQPSINPTLIEKYVENIKKRNNNRAIKKRKA